MPIKESIKLHSMLDHTKGILSSDWVEQVRHLINTVQGRAYQSGLDDGGIEHRFLVVHSTPSGEIISTPFETMQEYEGVVEGMGNQEYIIIQGERISFNEMRIELEKRRDS